MVIPNERLASGVLVNETLAGDAVGPDVAVWIPPAADATRAVAVLREVADAEVTVEETLPTGVRLAVGGDPVPPSARAARGRPARALPRPPARGRVCWRVFRPSA